MIRLCRVSFLIAVLGVICLAAGCSITLHLVVVNRSNSDLTISYQPGAFTDPDTSRRIVMLDRPGQAPAKRYKKLLHYSPLPESEMIVDRTTGVVTLTLAPRQAVMLAGPWTPSAQRRDLDSAFLQLGSPTNHQTHRGAEALSVFKRVSVDLGTLIIDDTALANPRVNLAVRSVTALADSFTRHAVKGAILGSTGAVHVAGARAAPDRPAGYAARWADERRCS